MTADTFSVYIISFFGFTLIPAEDPFYGSLAPVTLDFHLSSWVIRKGKQTFVYSSTAEMFNTNNRDLPQCPYPRWRIKITQLLQSCSKSDGKHLCFLRFKHVCSVAWICSEGVGRGRWAEINGRLDCSIAGSKELPATFSWKTRKIARSLQAQGKGCFFLFLY